MNAAQKLRQTLESIIASLESGKNSDSEWDLLQRLMGRMPVDQAEVERCLAERDLLGLDALVTLVEHPERIGDGPGRDPADVPDAEKRAAMKAFRKRLKLSRLADESRITGRLLTKGEDSSIDAIIPPHEYPRDVWDALVADGELKYTGQGFFAPV
jgi:hypothetical protein